MNFLGNSSVPKRFSVEITASAEGDISEIWEYIARDKPDAATEFILQLEARIDSLEKYPERCQLVPENELLGTGYRHLVYGNYRTVFKITGKRVIILRVINGSRLLDIGLLEGEEK